MPVISIYGKKDNNSSNQKLIKEASPEHKLRVCAYVRMSTESEQQLVSFDV